MRRLILITLCVLTAGLLPILLNLDNLTSSDFLNQQIPFIIETKRLLSSGTPFWSWNTFSGGNFIAQYSFYTITSPFVWIAILFPYKYLLWSILLSLYLKFTAGAIFAYIFLRKIGYTNNLATIGSLLYVFSCFFISNLFYFHFAEPIIMFPLLLLAIETVIERAKYCYLYLTLASFGVVFINYYFSFGSLILGFIYFLCRAKACKKLDFKLIVRSVFAVLIGIALSAFILVPVFLDVLQTARGIPGKAFSVIENADSSIELIHYGGRMLTRFVSLFFPTVYEMTPYDSLIDNSNWTSTEAYLMIFGLLTSYVHFKTRRNWLSWLIAILVIVYLLPPLNGFFTLYTSISYGRWLYGLLLFLILATLEVLKERIYVTGRELFCYIGGCLLLMFAVFGYSLGLTHTGEDINFSPTRLGECAVCVANFVCLIIWRYRQHNYKILLRLIVICGLLNLWGFAYFCVSHEDGLQFQSTNTSLFNENNSDYMSFRYDDISSFINTSMLTNRPGIYSSHSVYPKSMLPFRSTVDDEINAPSFENKYRNRSSVSTLLSVKEIRVYKDFKDTIPYDESELTPLSNTPEYDEYSFKYYIPMGFAYDTYIIDEDIINLIPQSDSIDIPEILLENLAIKSEDKDFFSKYLKEGTLNFKINKDSLVDARRLFTSTDFKGTSKGFSCHIDFPTPKVLFFSIPYDTGFKAKIDKTPVETYSTNLGMTAIIAPKGAHTLSFDFTPRGFKAGLTISAIALVLLIVIGVTDFRKTRKHQ